MTSDTITGAAVATGNVSGPASYATGGFLLDLSADLSSLGFLDLVPTTVGVLPPCHLVFTLNRDLSGAFAPGQAVVKIMRDRYNKASVGNVSGNPASTTVQAAKAAAGTTTGSSHTHTMDHDHPNTTSSVNGTGGGAVVALAAGVALSAHTHDVNVANFTGNTAASTHTHDRSFEYEHDHPVTQAASNAISTEIAAATDLSGTTWRFYAIGF